MCPDFVYRQDLELYRLPGKLSFNRLSPATVPFNVIIPRNSPSLYLEDAQEHYKLNKMLEMDEWKEWCIFKPYNHFYYA